MQDWPPMDATSPRETLAQLRHHFEHGFTRPTAWRRAQLTGIERFLEAEEAAIIEALSADLGRPPLESAIAEISFLKKEAAFAKAELSNWIGPRGAPAPLTLMPAAAEVQPLPKGVVLIIGPWNYPLQLVLGPLIPALAAGNCALIKPSELAPHTADCLAERLPKYIDRDATKLLLGDKELAGALLQERFDHIFYTGGPKVAKIVSRAAAEHLCPVTLELGGKSPCIVDEDSDLLLSARRILWGKFLNAGQTCVAPDYVLVHERVEADLLQAMKAVLTEFYGDDPKASPDFSRIINTAHHQRLVGLLPGGEVYAGGQHEEATRYLAPTILTKVDPEAPVMQEEIFGPILPVLPVESLDAAIRFVGQRPTPLALYLFSRSKRARQAVLDRTRSGGLTINHTLLHLSAPALPFGGLGDSGQGQYHGRYGFETFSHLRAVLKKPQALDPDLLYPPYTEKKQAWLRRLGV